MIFIAVVIRRAHFAEPKSAMKAAKEQLDWSCATADALDDSRVRRLRLLPLLSQHRRFVMICGSPAGRSPDVVFKFSICHSCVVLSSERVRAHCALGDF